MPTSGTPFLLEPPVHPLINRYVSPLSTVLTADFRLSPFLAAFIRISTGVWGTICRQAFRLVDLQASNSCIFFDLRPLIPLFAASRPLQTFVFNNLQPLFAKTGGWGHARQLQHPARAPALRPLAVLGKVPLPQEDTHDFLEA